MFAHKEYCASCTATNVGNSRAVRECFANSIYRWDGKICEGKEVLISAKTTANKWIDISTFIKSHHPYDLPEVIAYAPEKYEAHYGKWVEAEVK